MLSGQQGCSSTFSLLAREKDTMPRSRVRVRITIQVKDAGGWDLFVGENTLSLALANKATTDVKPPPTSRHSETQISKAVAMAAISGCLEDSIFRMVQLCGRINRALHSLPSLPSHQCHLCASAANRVETSEKLHMWLWKVLVWRGRESNARIYSRHCCGVQISADASQAYLLVFPNLSLQSMCIFMQMTWGN